VFVGPVYPSAILVASARGITVPAAIGTSEAEWGRVNVTISGIVLQDPLGPRTLWFVADPDLSISEVNEGNNFASLDITVELPPVVITILQPPTETVITVSAGRPLTVSGRVFLQGTAMPVSGAVVNVVIRDLATGTIQATPASPTITNGNGFFEVDVPLPESLPVGSYTAEVTVANGSSSTTRQTTFVVAKPTDGDEVLGFRFLLAALVIAVILAAVVGVLIYNRVLRAGKTLTCRKCGVAIPADSLTCPRCGFGVDRGGTS